ncbi:hypothetical protein OUZ56_002730 [Daphnia magna]|uniref:Uncharacterized protein n=1 Tax=Daphnia magna TaxID=35525 RepID=A0ABR0A6M9_9CRUS|nr:hypothetical protein OUZ56_002730 [Daphnia magna]
MCKGVAVENTHNAVLNENTAQYIGFEPFTCNKQTRPGITQSSTISNVATSIEVMETANETTSYGSPQSNPEKQTIVKKKKKKKVGIDVRLSYTPLHITVKDPPNFRLGAHDVRRKFNSTRQSRSAPQHEPYIGIPGFR